MTNDNDYRLSSGSQADLVALLHEIGGVIEEQEDIAVDLFPGDVRVSNYVRLTMTGDNLRRVRVVVSPLGNVEWEVIGQ